MINQKNNILKILHNSSPIKNAWKWANDNITLTLLSTDYLYLGYKKQLWQYYFDIQTANTNECEITAEKYNGTSWVSVDLFDETDGFKNSGFIYLDKNHGGVAHDSDEYVYIRLKLTATSSSMVFRGIDLVFCSESDLRLEEPSIERFYPRDFSSHILSMAAATAYIMKEINNSGEYKYNDIIVSQFTKWDLFNIDEIRQSAVFYALYKIYFNKSDQNDSDIYMEKAEQYFKKYESSLKIFYGAQLSKDENDDGEENEEENLDNIISVSFIR